MASITLSLIILTWNSEKYIHVCLHSVVEKLAEESLSFEIFVVDNGSTDSTMHILESYSRKYPKNIQIISLEKNTGTTYSRNLALKKSKGQYVCILDSDTCILSGSFREALEYLNEHQDVGLLAPLLVLPNGQVQHSVKKFPTFFQKLQKPRKIFGDKSFKDHDFYDDFPFTKETIVDSAISACWIFPRYLLSEVGLLDERIFYAPEDLDYCLRIWKSGKKIVFYPRIKILHNTQQITHQKPFGSIAVSHFLDLLYYFRKHGGWFSTSNICKTRRN